MCNPSCVKSWTRSLVFGIPKCGWFQYGCLWIKTSALSIVQAVQLVSSQFCGGVGSTVACESALRSAGTLLSRVRAPLPAPWPDGGPESLRSPCCGLAIYKNSNPPNFVCVCVLSPFVRERTD
ncbi:hypothetical protein PoB_000421500 [Plakobranchus ocellatus]|uniref:Uncharacterized protein n=1 Tax=Plakobranchus ocellatus TaxID=259542 RepID=A0AAV3Y4X0_9GAST|nr:hypothetical protein PoB_000421500 [Plakobranchus ocellatus]